jgi:hypothetical protein
LIQGEEFAEAELSDAERVQVAADTGEFLRALHDRRLADNVGSELPIDPMRRGDPGVPPRDSP